MVMEDRITTYHILLFTVKTRTLHYEDTCNDTEREI